jgi:hypothetical protein
MRRRAVAEHRSDVTGTILVIDADDTRRRALVASLKGRGCPALDVADPFAGMAALGRADFHAVLAAGQVRVLSLRGLLHLARRRHPGIALVMVAPHQNRSAIDQQVELQAALDVPVTVLDQNDNWERLVTDFLSVLPTETLLDEPESNPFAQPGSDAFGVPVAEDPVEGPNFGESERRIELHGALDDDPAGAGSALLMGMFVQQLTGRLTITLQAGAEGDDSGVLYIHRGEPVWTEPALGDAVLYRQLVRARVLAAEAPINSVAEGQLLQSLLSQELVSYSAVQEFMRERIRAMVISVAQAKTGTYHFIEDLMLLDSEPGQRINPFGLILESHKRSLGPSQIMATGMELERKYLVPGPGLGRADDRLQAFLNGRRASELVDGTQTVAAFTEQVGLDLFMGTLLVVTLQATRLISVEDQPRRQDVDLSEQAFADNEIGAVLVRVRHQQAPRGILGLAIDADADAIESARQRRRGALQAALSAAMVDAAECTLLMGKVDQAAATLSMQAPELDLTDF